MLHRFLLSESDGLVHLLPEQDMYREFFLVYHQSTEKIPRIRAAIDFLQSLTVE
jgi:DNA-binding transcriptional LysR family regulator